MNVYLALIFAAVSAFGGWSYSNRSADAEMATLLKNIADARAEAAEAVRERDKTVRRAVAGANKLKAKLKAERQRKDRATTQKVIEYVQSPDAGQCVMSDEWVRIHDSAASERVPDESSSASGSDVAAREVTDAEVLAVTVDNYQTCHGIAARLAALQDYVRAITETENN